MTAAPRINCRGSPSRYPRMISKRSNTTAKETNTVCQSVEPAVMNQIADFRLKIADWCMVGVGNSICNLQSEICNGPLPQRVIAKNECRHGFDYGDRSW